MDVNTQYELQPQALTLVAYDPSTADGEQLRGEAALCAWEYCLSGGIEDPGYGAVEFRHCMMYMAPSILLIYETMLLIEPDLPGYDWHVVPAIMDSLEPHILTFYDAGMDVVITQVDAYRLAAETALNPDLHV